MKKVDKKCICFVRVSTKGQDLTDQRKTVFEAATRDGYKENEIVVVEGKESAIKLDEEQRETLNEMKRLVEDYPTIESIYFFAVDRLARRISIVLSVKEWADERLLNLVFLNPHRMQTITIKDGIKEVDDLTNLHLTFLSHGAQMEMKLKQARFNTRKKEMKASGKLPQGKPIKGYYLDKDRTIKVDEVEAEFVRGIFNDYLNGNESLNSIHEKYAAKGFFEPVLSKYRNAGKNRVWSMLKDPSYCGEAKTNRRKVTKKVKGKEVVEYAESTITYPAIITKELYDAVQEKLRGRKAQPKHNHKHVYYAKELVRCAKCGNSMKVHSTDKTYTCKEVKGHTVSISVNVIDYIAWETAKAWYNYFSFVDWESAKEGYKEKADETMIKLENVTKEIERLTARKQSINKRFFSERNENRDLMSEDEFDSLIDEINVNIKGLEKKKVEYENEINRYNELYSQAGTNVLPSPSTLEMMDDSQRVKEVIKKVIKVIKVERYDENKADYKITVEPTDTIIPFVQDDNWYWEYFSKQRYVVFHLDEEHSEKRTYTRRFEARKRERAKLAKAAKG